MKILKIHTEKDKLSRYNYQVNYGVWDAIDGDKVLLEKFDKNLNNYDVVFLPMYKRWEKHINLLNKIKDNKIKKVLFDNDSCYRSFSHSFYDGIDYIFWRCVDKNGKEPNAKNSWLPWSINTELYKPIYGGNGVLFNCTIGKKYPLRQKISKIINVKSSVGEEYIKNIQNSAAAIHTDSDIVPVVRSKVLEFAVCGTQIISNRTYKMDYFFPDELIVYFNGIEDLKYIIKDFQPNIDIQKDLRKITEERHDDKIRANEVLNKIKEIL